jgi:hypothetical protein
MSLASTHQMIDIQRTHQPRMALAQIRDSDQRHSSHQLRFQDFNEVLDTLLAVVDGVQKGSSHPDRCGAETHAFENVGAAANTAVDEDFELGEDGGAVELAFEEGHDCWRCAGCREKNVSISRFGSQGLGVQGTYVSRLRPP